MANGKQEFQKRTKLHSRGEGPLQTLTRTCDNACKLAFHGKYRVSASFKVSNLSPFNVSVANLRTNPLKRKGMMEIYQKTQIGLIQDI